MKNLLFALFLLPILCFSQKPMPSGNNFKTATAVVLIDSTYEWLLINSQLTLSFKSYYNYDLNNRLISHEYFDIGNPAVHYRELITYNLNNKVSDSLMQQYVNGVWVNGYDVINSYAPNNNLTSQVEYSWNGSSWDTAFFSSYVYDLNNTLIKSTRAQRDSNRWINISQSEFGYDSNNNLILATYKYRQDSLHPWNDILQNVFTYDSNHNITEEISQSPYTVGQWINITKLVHTYDANNLETVRVQWDWDLPTSSWISTVSYTNNYDIYKNLVYSLEQRLYGTNWQNEVEYIASVDANNDVASGVQYYFYLQRYRYSDYQYDASHFQYAARNLLRDSSATIFDQGDSIHHYYHTVSTGLNEFSNNKSFSIFPNPSNGKFSITNDDLLNEISVYNSTGEKIYSDSPLNSRSREIDLSKNPKGIYFIKISSKGKYLTKKIIVN